MVRKSTVPACMRPKTRISQACAELTTYTDVILAVGAGADAGGIVDWAVEDDRPTALA